MKGIDRHVCMLDREPNYFDLPPTAGFCRHLLCKVRELQLPCAWHHGYLTFIRSHQSLKLERDRQLEHGGLLVCHPYSPAAHYWATAAMALGYLSLLYTPFEVFKTCPSPYNLLIICADVLALLDICMKFIIGNDQEDGNKVILDPREIARRYLRGSFVLDAVAALPFQCIDLFEGCDFPTHTAWYILKLFKLISISKGWKNFAKQVQLSYVTSVGIGVLARLVIFFHWMTYVYYQIPIFFVRYYNRQSIANAWIEHFNLRELKESTIMIKYSESIYYVSCLIIGGQKKDSENYEYLLEELMMNSAIGLAGLAFMTYCLATLLQLATYSRYEMFLYDGRLKELQDCMLAKQLPSHLQRKIELFIKYKFHAHYFNEQAIMNTINEQIKQDINMHCCKRLVMSVPMFQDMPLALINSIVFKLKQVLYMPGEMVMKYNQPGQSIYLIYSGTVAVINASGREVAHLRDGSNFGEAALREPGSLRSATIIALEITEIFKLSSKDLQACLQLYPHLKRRLDDARPPPRRPAAPPQRLAPALSTSAADASP